MKYNPNEKITVEDVSNGIMQTENWIVSYDKEARRKLYTCRHCHLPNDQSEIVARGERHQPICQKSDKGDNYE